MRLLRVKNRTFLLSARMAKDVLDFGYAIRGQEADPLTDLISLAKVVNDSLKATGEILGRFRGFLYWRFRTKYGITYLLERLSAQELLQAYLDILELEGGKKKLLTEERSSEETSPAE